MTRKNESLMTQLAIGLAVSVAMLGCVAPSIAEGDASANESTSGSSKKLIGDTTSGVFVRFKLLEPQATRYYIKLAGHIHKPNWYLPRATIPAKADRDKDKRIQSGVYTAWFDLAKHCGKLLHGRLNRAGGVAEFPNVTVHAVLDKPGKRTRLLIELATAPRDDTIVKRFDDAFSGTLTSFLISPTLRQDADSLETATQMSARRLKWALEATGGKRTSPKHHIIQTSLWGPQRPELNTQEAKVLWLLGFNVVGGAQRSEIADRYGQELRVPGHTHRVNFGPAATKAGIDALMKAHAAKSKRSYPPGVPFGMADEIAARPAIGTNKQALKHFHEWLAANKLAPKHFGVDKLTDVVPLETPPVVKEAAKLNEAAARRVFYYTSRFRQLAATQRIAWHTEAFHRYFPKGPVTSTLVADHPYFGGTGLGMGYHSKNSAWGSWPLALDWFDLTRRKAVDLIGIEDWMGLQYMYGPNYTWEGFQLMGFQASMMRSGGRSGGRIETPIIAWITPSDETNLRLKSFSSLAQGAKHFFYWTYGPTATSTENYWSDLRGSYDGIARVTRQLAAAEHLVHPGKLRKTKVALLYSISSDLWQPFDYIHMLERRGTYLSLVHGQYGVDMLTEEDVEAGRLDDYAALYVTDPCITTKATANIRAWVKAGGHLYGSCHAGSRNEFNEPVKGLGDVFGLKSTKVVTRQTGRYRVRGQLNAIPHLDRVTMKEARQAAAFDVIGLKIKAKNDTGEVIGTFKDGSAAVVSHRYGKGHAMYLATTPGISYIKDAKFVAKELKEKWPVAHREAINSIALRSTAIPMVKLSHPVVEAGVYDAPKGVAIVLANFTYQPIERLSLAVALPRIPKAVRLASTGKAIPYKVKPIKDARNSGPEPVNFPHTILFSISLGLDELVLIEWD